MLLKHLHNSKYPALAIMQEAMESAGSGKREVVSRMAAKVLAAAGTQPAALPQIAQQDRSQWCALECLFLKAKRSYRDNAAMIDNAHVQSIISLLFGMMQLKLSYATLYKKLFTSLDLFASFWRATGRSFLPGLLTESLANSQTFLCHTHTSLKPHFLFADAGLVSSYCICNLYTLVC